MVLGMKYRGVARGIKEGSAAVSYGLRNIISMFLLEMALSINRNK